MNTTTHTPKITHIQLFRKYNGNLKRANTLELQAAARSVPQGQNALSALFKAARRYEEELDKKYHCQGVVPAVCVNKDDLCEEDHCRCWN